jgi:trehalose-6-phosphatase
VIAARAPALEAHSWSGFRGVAIEHKPFGCAFHSAALPAVEQPRFHRQYDVAREPRYPRSGAPPARASSARPAGIERGGSRSVISTRSTGRGDLSLVMIGDDRTDEDLFRALDDAA